MLKKLFSTLFSIVQLETIISVYIIKDVMICSAATVSPFISPPAPAVEISTFAHSLLQPLALIISTALTCSPPPITYGSQTQIVPASCLSLRHFYSDYVPADRWPSRSLQWAGLHFPCWSHLPHGHLLQSEWARFCHFVWGCEIKVEVRNSWVRKVHSRQRKVKTVYVNVEFTLQNFIKTFIYFSYMKDHCAIIVLFTTKHLVCLSPLWSSSCLKLLYSGDSVYHLKAWGKISRVNFNFWRYPFLWTTNNSPKTCHALFLQHCQWDVLQLIFTTCFTSQCIIINCGSKVIGRDGTALAHICAHGWLSTKKTTKTNKTHLKHLYLQMHVQMWGKTSIVLLFSF